MVERAGASFEDAAVVENYIYRPPYPAGIHEKLLSIAPARSGLLDLGCGPGKVSRPLAQHFKTVIAIDPSHAMIALARSLENGQADNIRWITGFAEDFEGEAGSVDLVVAAASIHWMDHQRLFPRLRSCASPDHRVAVISGDTPFQPAWLSDWQAFLADWVPVVTGTDFDHDGKEEKRSAYMSFLDVEGSEFVISEPFGQSIEDFIRCQHSRDTFAPSRLGERLPAFDRALHELLLPYASDGMLRFVVRSRIVWGTIKDG